MRGIIVRVLVIGVIVIGGVLFRDRLSGNAGELKVGDCFDEPPGVQQTIDDVQHHPCTDPHTGEVFFAGNMPDAKGAPFPGEQAVDDFAAANCGDAFDRYVGTATDVTTLDAGYFYPSPDGWKGGDRVVLCYLKKLDGTPLTKSLKATGS